MAATNGRPLSARTEALLKELEASLTMLSAARYSRDGQFDRSSLDTAFDNGVDALKKLRTAARWPMRTVRSISNQAMDIRWSR
jgi:hypothetical protein